MFAFHWTLKNLKYIFKAFEESYLKNIKRKKDIKPVIRFIKKGVQLGRKVCIHNYNFYLFVVVKDRFSKGRLEGHKTTYVFTKYVVLKHAIHKTSKTYNCSLLSYLGKVTEECILKTVKFKGKRVLKFNFKTA